MTDDLDALHIQLDYRDRGEFALGNLPGFVEVEVIDGGQFKDRICLTTICRREDGSYWSLQWSEAANVFNSESNDYNMDSYIHRVDRIEISMTRKVVDWVRSRP